MRTFKARIFYYDTEAMKESFLVDWLIPTLRELKINNVISDYQYDRHWAQGPHFVVVLNSSLSQRELESTLRQHLDKKVSEIQPDFIFDHDAHLSLSKSLREAEQYQGEIEPIHPHGYIDVVNFDYTTRLGDFGENGISELYEPYRYRITTILESLLVDFKHMSEIQRDLSCMQLIYLVGLLDQPRSESQMYLSFTSHVYAFYAHPDPRAQLLKRDFESNELKIRKYVQALLDDIYKKVETLDLTTIFSAWYSTFKNLFDECERWYEDNKIFLEETQSKRTISGLRERFYDTSPFHKAWMDNPLFFKAVASKEYTVYRLINNFLYSLFPIFGISPVKKHFYCYCVSKYIETRRGLTWQEIFSRVEPEEIGS